MVDISREVRMRPCSLRLPRSTAVFLAALLSAPGCRARTSDASALSAQDVAAIKATLETWKQASLAGDWPAFFGHFTEDAVWIGPNGPPVEGRYDPARHMVPGTRGGTRPGSDRWSG